MKTSEKTHGAHIGTKARNWRDHKVRTGILIGLGALLVILIITSAVWLWGLPSVDNAEKYTYSQTTTVYASDEQTVLAEFYLQDRQPVAFDAISTDLVHATLATEDERFYQHGAVDPIGVLRALWNNISGGGQIQGASTITQQFVRNTMLIDEARDITLKRKAREAALAIEIEGRYSKDEILNMYLNTINYGDNCYGIQAASEHYFSKNASDLTLLEAATLAGIPQSPTAYTPTVNPDACVQRRNIVLLRMKDAGYITEAECDALSAEPLTLNVEPDRTADGIYLYPYFTSYVRETLLDQYSASDVYEGGLTVYTTLDVADQKAAEEACEAQYASYYNSNAEISLVSVDPDTGFIKALVGGKDFYTDQYNLATQAQRQAGSSFKVFTLTAAIKQGIKPTTMIDCTSPATLGTWKVENINNTNYGIRSIQSAIAVSSNTGFARLVQQVGAINVVTAAHDMGIKSDLEAVDSITLGTQGVTPLEMAGAFATLADGGYQRDTTPISKVIDRDGNTIYEWSDHPTQALTPQVTYAVTKCLETVFTQGTATAAQLYTGQDAAGKTGTSESYRDHWLIGYTPQLSTAVWIGSRQEQSLPSLDCCYVWKTYTNAALSGSPIETFPVADDPPYDNAFNTSQTQKYGAYSYSSSSSSSSSSDSYSYQSSSSSSSATSSSKSTKSSSSKSK